MNEPEKLVDSHCHIDFSDFDNDLEEVLERAADSGIGHMLCVGVDIGNIDRMIALSESNKNIYSSVGVHPNFEYVDEPEATSEDIRRVARHPRVVAIGETGLDYYRTTQNLDKQRRRFRAHIDAAKEAELPLIVHTRSAKADTIGIIAEHRCEEYGGVIHCFTEDWEMAQKALDLGFYISISGIVTFNRSDQLREVAKMIPLDRLLIETDSPYLAPVPKRGRRNEPSFVAHTARFLAALREETFDDFVAATTENFFSLFAKAEKS